MPRPIDLPWPCWVATTDIEGRVERLSAELGQGKATRGMRIEDLFTPASRLLLVGMLLPELRVTGHCQDILLELRLAGRGDIPVVCRARLDAKQDVTRAGPRVFWAFLEAPRRAEAERLLLRMRREAEREAASDGLTGLANRRGFLAAIDAGPRLLQGALAIIDIDHFKRINDRFGHPVGDEALRLVAQALRSGVREGDTVARLGGEEFIVWAPGLALPADALAFAERLRRAVAATRFPLADRGLTVSIGVTLAADMPRSRLPVLIEAADRALYEAKAEGRNRVRFRNPDPVHRDEEASPPD